MAVLMPNLMPIRYVKISCLHPVHAMNTETTAENAPWDLLFSCTLVRQQTQQPGLDPTTCIGVQGLHLNTQNLLPQPV
jgi:hypothetical protein